MLNTLSLLLNNNLPYSNKKPKRKPKGPYAEKKPQTGSKIIHRWPTCKPEQEIATEEYTKILESLIKQFPLAFSIQEIKILKAGIHKDLKERTELSAETIKQFLYRYCNLDTYKAAHIAGALRYDLEGEIAAYITEKEAKDRGKKEKGGKGIENIDLPKSK